MKVLLLKMKNVLFGLVKLVLNFFSGLLTLMSFTWSIRPRRYADYTFLFLIVRDMNLSANTLNNDLLKLITRHTNGKWVLIQILFSQLKKLFFIRCKKSATYFSFSTNPYILYIATFRAKTSAHLQPAHLQPIFSQLINHNTYMVF